MSVVERQDRQGNAELNIFPAKKMQTELWGKGGCQQSYQGVPVAVTTAAATTGSLLCITPRKKRDQENKSLGGISKPALGRTFPSWE